jgi:hypothetical protein
MTKNISIILGSGFSVPDGMKTVQEINDFIVNLDETNFTINHEMILTIGNYPKSNYVSSIHSGDKLFFLAFIKWYIDKINSNFHYEDFFDFFSQYRIDGTNTNLIEPFFNDFKCTVLKSQDKIDGVRSYISRFSEYFNQLLANLLQSNKYYEDVELGNYPPYDDFTFFLSKLIQSGKIINVHSLNHDLLFEHIASKQHQLSNYFTDGYTDVNSDYYGNVNLKQSISKTYKVRLKYFTNEFTKPLRLFKLHGSVDTYIANLEVNNFDPTRVKKDWGVNTIQKEIITEYGQKAYTETYQSTHPDFLSGTVSKIRHYTMSYYKELHEHFSSNLNESLILIVIGYGFHDDEINRVIQEDFLRHRKKMVVIDIKTPSSRLVSDYNVSVIQKSISEIKIKEWQSITKLCI